MDWEHSVATEWLEERRDVITATELVGLIPEYKRWKKSGGKQKPLAFYSLWEEKMADSELDPMSYGPAARGHVMEPYAVKDYNMCRPSHAHDMAHWDDCIIKNGSVGFSPDGMDIVQQTADFCLHVQHGKLVNNQGVVMQEIPKQILEIKSYGVDRHAKAAMSDIKDKQLEKERYQIAAAMLTLPTVEVGWLCLYCPQAVHSLVLKEFTREDLEEEIELLQEIIDLWEKCSREMNSISLATKAYHTEKEIWIEHMEERSPVH
ncbi:hypothetical protein [Paratractidigestivibacter sp.]|uniref:hypothetical protein n=1 Tax=Paratractidigestivibacter sp. TaxID=2847316 RepID=UPI002AC98CE5|nr:hypothetical protein [Paratractidigestivibacter sp.]